MPSYCTIDDVRNIVPKNIVIGTNLMKGGTVVLESQVESWISDMGGVIDGYISSFYRIPLKKYKEPNWEQYPITFTEFYPPPIPLINARLTSAMIYDHIIMANQEPNVSEWGKNIRSLAFDDLAEIQSGLIQLKNQEMIGRRFVRQELFDASRAPLHSNMSVQPNSRNAGA